MNRQSAEIQYVEVRPCAHTEGCFSVWLVVEQQSFCLDYVAEDKEDAEWMAEMLCRALMKIAAMTTEPNQPEADRQRRIEECAKEIRYWHRMQADMGHAGKNLREILFRYIT